MGCFSKTARVGRSLILVGIIFASLTTCGASGEPQAEPAADKEVAHPELVAANHKAYTFADLATLKIFGNDLTAERLQALAAIAITSADQVKGFIEQYGGDRLMLRVPKGDHAKPMFFKITPQTEITVDGRAAKTVDRRSFHAALVRTNADGSTALKIAAQTLPQSDDDKSHQILDMAAEPGLSRLYVAEAVGNIGGADKGKGEYLLWSLAKSGQVMDKRVLKKKDDSYDPPPGTLVLSLPAPQQGAIVMGPFGKLSGIHQWRLFRVDGQGATAAELEGIWSCHGATLTADNRDILAVGDNVGVNRLYGMLWKLNLDGKILSKKSYERRTMEDFNDIALADEQGDFIIAEDSPKAINKFGLSEGSVWLLRCDRDGKVLTETSFPGRRPRIRALSGGRFAVLYQTLSPTASDWQLQVVDLQLKKQWEKKLGFAGFGINPPAFCPTVNGGLVAAIGPGVPPRKKADQLLTGIEVVQWDSMGHKLFSASIPALSSLIRQEIHTACLADDMYVAVRTAGFLFQDEVESSIYRIPLPAVNDHTAGQR
jgi:hypothetical protein